MRLALTAAACALCMLVAPAHALGAYPRVHREETVIADRFGNGLKSYLEFPAQADGSRAPGRFPVVLHYTYFPTVTWEAETAGSVQRAWTLSGFNLVEGFERLVREGYVVAHVSPPGTGGSQGAFNFNKDGRFGLAGHDAVEWLAVQPWSTGNVGMFGGSGNGIAQLMTAITHPPHLRTIIPAVAFTDLYRDTLYPGGMPAMGDALIIEALAVALYGYDGTLLPDDPDELRFMLETLVKRVSQGHVLTPPTYLLEWYSHPTRSSYWDPYTYDVTEIDIPVWSWGGWDDHFTTGNVDVFKRSASRHRMLAMGYNGHSAGPDFDIMGEALRWYDRWLKGHTDNGVDHELQHGRVRYYVREANRWRTAVDWPPPQASTLMLHAGPTTRLGHARGDLRRRAPRAAGRHSYLYTPAAIQLGAQNGFVGQGFPGLAPRRPNTDANAVPGAYNNPTGQLDQRLWAPQCVTYAGAPLRTDTEITGEPDVTLWATSTSSDTDWVVKLVDVFPATSRTPQPGYWNLVSTGFLKGTHRNGHVRPEPIPTGRPVRYDVALRPMSYEFKKAHRIGMQVCSSDPRTLPNPRVSRNTILFGQRHDTRVALPVVP